MEFVQNSTLQINVNISGAPLPNVTWTHKGIEIMSDGRITITNTGLTITNVQHTDAGIYSVTAQNCVETEAENYNVRINCKYSLLYVNALTCCVCHYCSSTKCNIDKNP